MTDKPKHGGARPNSGAKPTARGAMVNLTFRVYVDQREHVKVNGGGAFSRQLIDEDMQRGKTMLEEEYLLTESEEIDDEGEDEEGGICPDCAGSGEGMHEGTTCRTCKGLGEC